MIRNLIEFGFLASLFVNAALFIPQVIKLYKLKNSRELSFVTFFGFNLIQLFIILHGYLHGDKLLILGTFCSLLTCGAVTYLILFYRFRRNLRD